MAGQPRNQMPRETQSGNTPSERRESNVECPPVMHYSYGPVPSRRLGRSLGINNIPAKVCTYSCVYCQAGATRRMQSRRGPFHDVNDLIQEVRCRLGKAGERGEPVDYLAFVPDGEPTLNSNLGEEIRLAKKLGLPVAVITNGSLLWRADVRDALCEADWVSVKVDAVQKSGWRRMNRPHSQLQLPQVLDGVFKFAEMFTGTLVTETMLVRGINDTMECLGAITDVLHDLQPETACLSIPTRPPAKAWVEIPDKQFLKHACEHVADSVGQMVCLFGYEGDDFSFTDDVENDLLNITAVHPMRAEAVKAFLERAAAPWQVVERLVEKKALVERRYGDDVFYCRAENHANPGLRFNNNKQISPEQ